MSNRQRVTSEDLLDRMLNVPPQSQGAAESAPAPKEHMEKADAETTPDATHKSEWSADSTGKSRLGKRKPELAVAKHFRLDSKLVRRMKLFLLDSTDPGVRSEVALVERAIDFYLKQFNC